MTDYLFFGVFPYVALVVAVGGGVYRYAKERFSFSSLSSQFLENRALFWGSVAWHYGIVLVLLAHLAALLLPASWGRLLGDPLRLAVLEVTGLALGLFTLAGIVVLLFRRIASPKAWAVVTVMDLFLLAVLVLQVGTGLYNAFVYRWGSLWYLSLAVPWLHSLACLNPDIKYIVPLPLPVKVHLFNAFVIFVLFPVTRLVHIVSIPVSYLWRPWQIAVWNKPPRWMIPRK
ncbi:respiratory nitrate reductase, cytochrome b gamma subunit [Geobacter metallireducens GS-15]|uniref:Respiratory nitrate reductase, cytochrome b gamma subunit n=2 Tax=Geobacter metallireducens TaxID=28232 RepID=Q39WW0_GEOMG|nr:respiratory nitrate reductase, cytochrome b gamma subunit [Geobacter metallireducens GS-15]